jgi:hypothetical protein
MSSAVRCVGNHHTKESKRESDERKAAHNIGWTYPEVVNAALLTSLSEER